MRPLLLFSVIIALTNCSKSNAEKALPAASALQTNTPSPPASAPELTASAAAPSPSGMLQVVSAAELRTKIRASNRKGTIVNAFASWCGPCRKELPMLQAMADNLARQGVDVVLVSVDEPEDNAKARSFLDSLQIRLPSYLAARPLGIFKEGLYPRWPGMLPATFLFDGRGVAHFFWGGPAEDEEILSVVEGFLAGKNIDGEADFTIAPGTVDH